MRSIRSCVIVLLAQLAVLGGGPALAQPYPAKPIRLLVGFPPGGGADFTARLTAQKLSEATGQQVLVDNRAGANGIIATELAAKSPPDGYTLLLGVTATHAINPNVFSKLPYDAVRDFAPVTNVGYTPLILVVNRSLPVTSVQELIALARARPNELNFASAGNGNVTHLAAELFKMMANVKMVHVPYKGSAPAIIDLMAGQVALYFDTMPSSIPHVKAGKLRGLAVSSAQRSRTAPAIPTIAEAGVPGYETMTWFGVFAPAATPRDVIIRLNGDIVKSLAQADTQEKLFNQGLEAIGDTPEQFAALLRAEIDKWGKVIRDAGIRVE